MPSIDRDVFMALGEHTAAGKRALRALAEEMSPRNAQDLPDWMLGYHKFESAPKARRFVDAVAYALYRGMPNASSVTAMGRAVRERIKAQLIRIVTKGDV